MHSLLHAALGIRPDAVQSSGSIEVGPLKVLGRSLCGLRV